MWKKLADEGPFPTDIKWPTVDDVQRYKEEFEKQMAVYQQNHTLGQPQAGSYTPDPISIDTGRKDMIMSRLRHQPFQRDWATFLVGNTVYVVVACDNDVLTLKDSSELFPSDEFMSQLRLLIS